MGISFSALFFIIQETIQCIGISIPSKSLFSSSSGIPHNYAPENRVVTHAGNLWFPKWYFPQITRPPPHLNIRFCSCQRCKGVIGVCASYFTNIPVGRIKKMDTWWLERSFPQGVRERPIQLSRDVCER